MKILRRAIVAAGTAATILTSTTPASAQTAIVFEGSASIGCFGCGTYGPAGNGACFSVTGVIHGTAVVNAGGCATFTVTEPIGATCVVSGSAQGEITLGGDTYTFTWTRFGAVAIISVPDLGTGAATFLVTSPAGNPCGGSVTARFAGELAGA